MLTTNNFQIPSDDKKPTTITRTERYPGITALKQYPKNELYRLIVEGRLQKNEGGWVMYENREPGSLKAALSGLAFAVSDIEDRKLTLDYIKKLHATLELKGEPKGLLRENIAGFIIQPQTATEEGVLELLNMIETQKDFPKYHGSWIACTGYTQACYNQFEAAGNLEFSTAIYHHSIEKIRTKYGKENNAALAADLYAMIKKIEYVYFPPRRCEAFDQTLKSIIDNYNVTIAEAKDEDSKLEAIVKIISGLNHLHPFIDGNIRTFAILLLNRLLIQNGFYPVTFYDPNCFDAHSKKELILIVKESMQNTKEILNGKKDLFGFESSSDSDKNQDQEEAGNLSTCRAGFFTASESIHSTEIFSSEKINFSMPSFFFSPQVPSIFCFLGCRDNRSLFEKIQNVAKSIEKFNHLIISTHLNLFIELGFFFRTKKQMLEFLVNEAADQGYGEHQILEFRYVKVDELNERKWKTSLIFEKLYKIYPSLKDVSKINKIEKPTRSDLLKTGVLAPSYKDSGLFVRKCNTR